MDDLVLEEDQESLQDGVVVIVAEPVQETLKEGDLETLHDLCTDSELVSEFVHVPLPLLVLLKLPLLESLPDLVQLKLGLEETVRLRLRLSLPDPVMLLDFEAVPLLVFVRLELPVTEGEKLELRVIVRTFDIVTVDVLDVLLLEDALEIALPVPVLVAVVEPEKLAVEEALREVVAVRLWLCDPDLDLV